MLCRRPAPLRQCRLLRSLRSSQLWRDFCTQFDDQGLVNTDPRFIAVPASYINLIPTDVRGLTFNRSPQMVRTAWVLAPSAFDTIASKRPRNDADGAHSLGQGILPCDQVLRWGSADDSISYLCCKAVTPA